MGLFSSNSIVDFVRELLVCRVETDVEAMKSSFGRKEVEGLGTAQLMSTPEATIVKIMEAVYANLATPNILEMIERHRSQIGSLPRPIPESIDDYVLQRVALEHPRTIAVAHVKLCIGACHHYFGAGSFYGKALSSVERARRQQAEDDLFFTWFAIDDWYVEGILTEDEFMERIDVLYERLAPLLEQKKQQRAIDASGRISISRRRG